MSTIKFKDINLMDVGHTTQLVGAIYHDMKRDGLLLCVFPEEKMHPSDETLLPLEMTLDEWSQFILQGDILDTAVVVKEQDGKLGKAILRKSQRQIEQGVSWKVYRRDGFKCRYCGADDVPLTVDHLVLWESGGPSIEANLVSACRKCNRLRGNMLYKEWLESPAYKQRSQNISALVRADNLALLETLQHIPLIIKPRSR